MAGFEEAGFEGAEMAERGAAADARTAGEQSQPESQRTLGATEDQVDRSDAVIAPEVTDMGLDERGRDQPNGTEFGRGAMPDNPAIEDIEDTGGEPDVPRYGHSPRQGLGGARPRDEDEDEDGRVGGHRETDDDAKDTGAADTPGLTSSGTLRSEHVVGQGDSGPYGQRGDGGGGMLNTEVPAGMAGTGPLGGSPARGDTADAAARRRHEGQSAPSSPGSRDIHLGIGHNSPTGESTPDGDPNG